MDDQTLLKSYIESFQRLPFPEAQARNVAGIVRSVLGTIMTSPLPFESEMSTFLPALEADDDA